MSSRLSTLRLLSTVDNYKAIFKITRTIKKDRRLKVNTVYITAKEVRRIHSLKHRFKQFSILSSTFLSNVTKISHDYLTALHKQTDKRLKPESLKMNSIVHKETKDFHLELKKIRIKNTYLGGGAWNTLIGYNIVYLGKPKQQPIKIANIV